MLSRLGAVLPVGIAVILAILAFPFPGYAASRPRLRIIVVDSPAKAEQILAALRRGEDFAKLAKQSSTDPSADAGGDLGAIRTEDLRAELRDAAQQLQPEQISPVIKIPTGWAILQMAAAQDSGDTLALGEEAGAQLNMPSSASPSVTGRSVVRQIPETSGLIEVEAAFRSMPKPARWNYDLNTLCQLHQNAVSHLQNYLETLTSGPIPVSTNPDEGLQKHYAAALIAAYQGRMDDAIKHWEACYRIAQTESPDRAPMIEEVLGDAYLHKAEMDNNVYAAPGDRCIFPPQSSGGYPKYEKTEDVTKAIAYFSKYLERKPDDLEVKWILNLAYMALGEYPGGVPAKYRITAPATEAPGESIGRFVDVAHQAGLDVVQLSGGVIVEDFANRGLFDVVTSGYDVCGHLLYFHNNGDGTFSDRSEATGLAKIAAGANPAIPASVAKAGSAAAGGSAKP